MQTGSTGPRLKKADGLNMAQCCSSATSWEYPELHAGVCDLRSCGSLGENGPYQLISSDDWSLVSEANSESIISYRLEGLFGVCSGGIMVWSNIPVLLKSNQHEHEEFTLETLKPR